MSDDATRDMRPHAAPADPAPTGAGPRNAVPAVSVIVPVYNVERYLPECLDSLLAQTYRDFEVVLVDDGSTDTSRAIADRYAVAHPARVRVLGKPNGGLADARNFGIEHARGSYLAFVDSDDTVSTRFLEALHGRAAATRADLVLCGMADVDEAGEVLSCLPEPDISVFGRSLAEDPRMLYRVDASACDKLYARGLFERSGIRFPVGVAFEDVPTTYRLLPHASRVEKVDEPLYRYRRHRSGSITFERGERFLDLVEAFRTIDASYAEDGIFERYRSPLLRLHLTHLIAGRYPDFFPEAEPAARRRYLAASFGLLDERFPGWRTDRVCRELWPNAALRAISTHERLIAAFSRLPRRAFLGLLSRMGAFDPGR